MRRFISVALVLLVVLLVPAGLGAAGVTYRIDHVTDGDTVVLRNGWKVRLVQIDTPEVYFGTECYGRQASATTKRLLPTGSRVRLLPEPSTDRVDDFGRLLPLRDPSRWRQCKPPPRRRRSGGPVVLRGAQRTVRGSVGATREASTSESHRPVARLPENRVQPVRSRRDPSLGQVRAEKRSGCSDPADPYGVRRARRCDHHRSCARSLFPLRPVCRY